MARVQVRYHGRVQGVGFRATVRHAAQGFAVTGWVRNEPDGSVLLEAQGEPADLEQFLDEVARALGRFIHATHRSAVQAECEESGFIIAR